MPRVMTTITRVGVDGMTETAVFPTRPNLDVRYARAEILSTKMSCELFLSLPIQKKIPLWIDGTVHCEKIRKRKMFTIKVNSI